MDAEFGEGDTAKKRSPGCASPVRGRGSFFLVEARYVLGVRLPQNRCADLRQAATKRALFRRKKWRVDAASEPPRLICAVERTCFEAFLPLTAHVLFSSRIRPQKRDIPDKTSFEPCFQDTVAIGALKAPLLATVRGCVTGTKKLCRFSTLEPLWDAASRRPSHKCVLGARFETAFYPRPVTVFSVRIRPRKAMRREPGIGTPPRSKRA